MKHIQLIAFCLLFFPQQSISAEIAALGLTQSYSRDAHLCREAAALLSEDNACRPHNTDNLMQKCGGDNAFFVLVGGTLIKVFEEVATNEYGYTEVYHSIGSSLNGFDVVYVQRFQGDRHPRLVETWKVNSSDFDNVLKIPPGPITYAQAKSFLPRETNALEFEDMLKRGEKLSDEWSPVIDIFGEPYLVERECSGEWGYGGYYACNKVIKLTVKKLFKDKNAVPYCQYSKTKK